jgi:hypothetical protein
VVTNRVSHKYKSPKFDQWLSILVAINRIHQSLWAKWRFGFLSKINAWVKNGPTRVLRSRNKSF